MRKTNTSLLGSVRTKILKQMSSTSSDNVHDRQADRHAGAQAGTGSDTERQTANNCFYLALFF